MLSAPLEPSNSTIDRERGAAQTVSLPLLRSGGPKPVRQSRNSRWRFLSLLLVHLVMIGHIVHWRIAGRTLTPVEPSEAMYAINEGHLNAGAIFFAAAILGTLIFGRFFCGWGCHLVAYQDLCAWMLKKIGIKPKPFRSRLLVFAPFTLAVYMFVWPTLVRWWSGLPRPALSNHLMTNEFWATFPGWTIAVLTIAVCGFGIVYFLGSKGFCTYACPYGGFFRLADRGATGRILVTDACKHCGHCTATCTSNVRVHEEVALYGMVVDPGCMKCMDCVSVCPNDALHFGFASPPIGAKPKAARKPTPFDFALWEEFLMVVAGLGALLVLRGLYGQIPLLFAMGLAAITAYVLIKFIQLVRVSNVRLQNLLLKRGRRLTRAGVAFVGCMAIWSVFLAHSSVVQAHSWMGRHLLASLDPGDEVWLAGHDWPAQASETQRSDLETAIRRLERADGWGLLSTPLVLRDLVWAYLAGGDIDRAEKTVRRMIDLMPDQPEPYRGLAGVLRKAGRSDEAVGYYREALEIQPTYALARNGLCGLLVEMERVEEAIAEYRAGMEAAPDDAELRMELAQFLVNLKRFPEAKALLTGDRAPSDFGHGERASARAHALLGIALLETGEPKRGMAELRRAIRLEPDAADARYNLGLALLERQRIAEAIEHLQHAVEVDPQWAQAHYNLAVAAFMAGRPADALPHIQEAARLAPDDPDTHGFLAVVLEHLGDPDGARQAVRRARAVSRDRP